MLDSSENLSDIKVHVSPTNIRENCRGVCGDISGRLKYKYRFKNWFPLVYHKSESKTEVFPTCLHTHDHIRLQQLWWAHTLRLTLTLYSYFKAEGNVLKLLVCVAWCCCGLLTHTHTHTQVVTNSVRTVYWFPFIVDSLTKTWPLTFTRTSEMTFSLKGLSFGSHQVRCSWQGQCVSQEESITKIWASSSSHVLNRLLTLMRLRRITLFFMLPHRASPSHHGHRFQPKQRKADSLLCISANPTQQM